MLESTSRRRPQRKHYPATQQVRRWYLLAITGNECLAPWSSSRSSIIRLPAASERPNPSVKTSQPQPCTNSQLSIQDIRKSRNFTSNYSTVAGCIAGYREPLVAGAHVGVSGWKASPYRTCQGPQMTKPHDACKARVYSTTTKIILYASS